MYNQRAFIADKDVPSTSTIVCYSGPPSWDDKDNPERIDKFVSISDCHNSVRLHQVDAESDEQFIKKINNIINELNLYVQYLERT